MNCKNHKDIPSTHVTARDKIPLCDECTAKFREQGIIVQKHRGFLWGYPIVVEGDDGILDAPILEEKCEQP